MGMTQTQILARIAAILTTLAETGGGPESSIYLALGSDMDLWTKIRNALLEANQISIRGHWVTLTPNGRATAAKLAALDRS